MALLLYGLWIGGPYLHSIVVRDAAVTTWLHVATAPISGQLDDSALHAGSVVGHDQVLATITNPRADRTALARAEADLAAGTARAQQLAGIVAERRRQFEAYAAEFIRDLDLRAASQAARSGYVGERLAKEKAEAGRLATLQATGNVSASVADAAAARVAAMEVERVTADDDLQRTKLRRENAARGVFLAEDGREADWAGRLDPLRGNQEHLAFEQEVATARAVAEAARHAYEHNRAATLTAPEGAIVWSRFAAPGATVAADAAVMSWIDPKVLLVDAPVSDAAASLLHAGSRARVIIEGERRARDGVVVLTRGSAATLDVREVAAIAKGRRPGGAEAVVRIDSRHAGGEPDVVGRAAYVEFPEVGLLDILRVRLRW